MAAVLRFGWVRGTEESGRAEMSPQQQATACRYVRRRLITLCPLIGQTPALPLPQLCCFLFCLLIPHRARISYALFGDEVRSLNAAVSSELEYNVYSSSLWVREWSPQYLHYYKE